MRKLLSSTLAVLLLWSASNVCPAQENAGAGKPLVIVSFAGYNALRGQIDAVGKLVGNPKLADTLELILTQATQGKGPAGLDKTRPWGAAILVNGREKGFDELLGSLFAFVPVTDLKQLMALGPDPMTGRPLVPGPDGVYEIKVPGKSFFVVQKGAWAFVANDREVFKSVPADPASLLGDLPKQYTLACRISMKNLPQALRNTVNMQLQNSIQAWRMVMRMNTDNEEGYAALMPTLQRFVTQLSQLFKDLDEVLVGVSIDQTHNTANVDLRLTANAGSVTAKKFSQVKDATTVLSGFALPDAAVTANWAFTLDDNDLDEAKQTLARFHASINRELDNSDDLNKDQVKVAKDLVSDLLGVAEKTLEGKKVDYALTVLLKPRASTFLAGGLIVDGNQLDKVLKRLVAEIAKDDAEFGKLIKLDAEVHEGAHLHVATIPVKSRELADLVGDEIEVAAGIAADRVYVGAGHDAVKLLKDAISKSKAAGSKPIPAVRISVAGTPIAKFVAGVPGAKGTPS